MTETPSRTRSAAASARVKRKERVKSYELEADAIKALANPKRLLILDLLTTKDERTVGDLEDLAGISQANLSQNLAILRNAGLVAARRQGNLVYYRLADERIAHATSMIRAVARDRAEDADVQDARENAKHAAAHRRNSLIGASITFALLSAIALAALHPLVNGGTWMDVQTHVRLLLASPDLTTLAQNCREVATNAPPMPAMGSGAA